MFPSTQLSDTLICIVLFLKQQKLQIYRSLIVEDIFDVLSSLSTKEIGRCDNIVGGVQPCAHYEWHTDTGQANNVAINMQTSLFLISLLKNKKITKEKKNESVVQN